MLPYPTLLIGESAQEFESVRAEFELQIQPNGIIEQKYVDDIASLAWEILRMRRAKANMINLAFRSALTDVLICVLPEMEGLERRIQAEALSSDWFTDPEAKKEVAQLLAQRQLDESAIEAQAMKRCLSELEQLEARYHKVLDMIAVYRDGLAQQLREATDKPMKGRNVLRLEDVSSHKPPAA
jgi:hypothetical protein